MPVITQPGATVVQYAGVELSRATMTSAPIAASADPSTTRRPGRACGAIRFAMIAVTGTKTGPSATASPVRRAE